MDSSQNEKIQNLWEGSLPLLKNNEAILEGGYTLLSFRGNNIMPAAISGILQIANNDGIRYVLTFVHINNTPSLKGIKRSGFFPYTLRIEKWFLFKKTVSFIDIPPNILEKYYSKTSS